MPPIALTLSENKPSQPPQSFLETIRVPTSKPQTAIGIMNAVQIEDVAVTFHLTRNDGNTAIYSAQCPRCHEGVIEAFAVLKPDGSFSEHPAIPTLCEYCESQLDAILDGGASARSTYEESNRVSLKKFVRPLRRV